MTEQMTPLRRRMIDDMTVRNMSPLTQKAYVRAVKNFSKFFRQSPDELNFEDVREYQLHLVSRGLDATTTNQIMSALRSSTKRHWARRTRLNTFHWHASLIHCPPFFRRRRLCGF